MYGYLGDITKILENLTDIEKLYLYGNFQLSRSVTLKKSEIRGYFSSVEEE